MKLYYTPNACSLAPHIMLHETGALFELVKVDLASKTTMNSTDFLTINPKGQVPTLELASGMRLTEGVAIVQYLADQNPSLGLLPAAGTFQRARVQEVLNFISSELHKAFNPLFNPAASKETRNLAVQAVRAKLELLAHSFADGREWLAGDFFSPADCYGFAVARWAPMQNISLEQWPDLVQWMEKVSARQSVQAALASESDL